MMRVSWASHTSMFPIWKSMFRDVRWKDASTRAFTCAIQRFESDSLKRTLLILQRFTETHITDCVAISSRYWWWFCSDLLKRTFGAPKTCLKCWKLCNSQKYMMRDSSSAPTYHAQLDGVSCSLRAACNLVSCCHQLPLATIDSL